MSVELGLAAVATADLALKYGEKLIGVCSAFKAAETEISERIVMIEMNWTKTRCQIDFLKRIWQDLDTEHRNHQTRVLQILASKLDAAVAQIERVQNKRSMGDETDVKKWKYALIRESIDNAIQDLGLWQSMFDPSWYLILRMASPAIDQGLARCSDERIASSRINVAKNVRRSLKVDTPTHSPIFLPKDGLQSHRRDKVPFSSAEVMHRPSRNNTYFIVDRVPCPAGVDAAILTEDVRDLARKLSAADPLTFGMLQCKGVVKENNNNSRRPEAFSFVFMFPPQLSAPRSLRDLLCSFEEEHSLSDRFSMARQLAKAVSYMHTLKFVHKNIRPETILVFKNDRSPLAAAYLIGFQKFRFAHGNTVMGGDLRWEKNLYRHPRRQGLSPEDRYAMQHDIYSLGVCLLEVGLWRSFVEYEMEPRPSLILPAVENGPEGSMELIKDSLLDLARRKLPSCMGDKYTAVVVNCLTCLDETNMDFGDESEFQDEDGILIGVRYIEKILLSLDSISI